jgi:hypothetical protein
MGRQYFNKIGNPRYQLIKETENGSNTTFRVRNQVVSTLV